VYTLNNEGPQSQANIPRIPATTFVNIPGRLESSTINRLTQEYQTGPKLSLNRNVTANSASSLVSEPDYRPARTPDRVYRTPDLTPASSLYLPNPQKNSVLIQKSVVLNQTPAPVTADDINRLSEDKGYNPSADFLQNLSREELIMRLENAYKVIHEYRTLITGLKVDGVETERNAHHIRQIQNLTNEITGLKEQLYKLKNLANDDLVILEKAVTTEVYGKKSQIAIELEEARRMKADFENLQRQFRDKETRIHTFEKEVVELRTIIDRQGHDLNRSGPSIQEFERITRELTTRNNQLQSKDRELQEEKARTGYFSQQISSLQRELDAAKKNPPPTANNPQVTQLRTIVDAKQQEISQLIDRLANQTPVVRYERVVPPEVMTDLDRLRTSTQQKDHHIESLNNQVKDLTAQNGSLQRQITEMRTNFDALRTQTDKELTVLRETRTSSDSVDPERLKLTRQLSEVRTELETIRSKKEDEINRLRGLVKSGQLGEVERSDLVKELEKLRRNITDLTKRNYELDGEADSLRTQLQRLEGETAKLRTSSEHFEFRLKEKNDLLEEKGREFRKLREEINSFKNMDFSNVDLSRLFPSGLSDIIIEQQRQKLDAYKARIERYEADTENLRKQLNALQSHDTGEGAFLRGQLENTQQMLEGLNREVAAAKRAKAEAEMEAHNLQEQNKALKIQLEAKSMSPTKMGPRFEDLIEDSRRDSLAKVKEVRELLDKEVNDNNGLRELKRVLEGKVDALRKQLNEAEVQADTARREADRLGSVQRQSKSESEVISRRVEELQQKLDRLNGQDEERKNGVKNTLKRSRLDRHIVEKITKILNERPIEDAMEELLEQVAGEKKKTQSEGTQTFVMRNDVTSQTDLNMTGLASNLLTQTMRTDNDGKSVAEADLADVRSKMAEQMQTNQRLDAKVESLTRENERLRDKVRSVKDKNSQIQLVKETLIKEREVSGRRYTETPPDEHIIKPLMDENQRLKGQVGDLQDQITVYRERQVKKKKAILNEICNFVNTKNGYEQALITEVTRTAEVTVVVNEREDYNSHTQF
jgi:chromosome segregation ATPase